MALPKGRILDACLAFLSSCGMPVPPEIQSSRKLQLDSADGRYRYVLVKPVDIPTYVEYGVADAGICGLDVLTEQSPDVHQPLDLKFGLCRMVVAGRPDAKLQPSARVATKYPAITEDYFHRRGMLIEIIPLSGSVELAPALGLAERIVDLVETGSTLRENGLVILEEIMACTARLIINRASFHTRQGEVSQVLSAMEAKLS